MNPNPHGKPEPLEYERNDAAREVNRQRAFARGVGVVFQFVGVLLFLSMMGVCCISSLAGPERMIRADRMDQGWNLPWDAAGTMGYPVPLALTAMVFAGIFFGLALAALGLGMQAEHRRAAYGAIVVCGLAVVFFLVHALFAYDQISSSLLAILCLALAVGFALLLALAVGAMQELIHHPPPPGHEVLPADYKVPYSHLHQDPPEVRLAREIEQRRQRLAVQQRELEMMEGELRRRNTAEAQSPQRQDEKRRGSEE